MTALSYRISSIFFGHFSASAVCFIVAVALLLLPSVIPDARADGADPMVRITALPIDKDPKTIMAGMSKHVSEATGLDESLVTYYWQTFDAVYCPGCDKAGITTPFFVDLYTPGFLSKEERKNIMTAVAEGLSEYAGCPLKDIFIHTHIAEKDQLFMNGGTVENWKQVGGPDE